MKHHFISTIVNNDKIRITAVSYLNTIPFIWGLEHSKIINNIDLQRDYPAICAEKLIIGQVDAGLIPVGALIEIPHYDLIPGLCIGAVSNVRTVQLFSKTELHDIKAVYLDYQSRTSVKLTRVLAEHYWKINVEWKHLSPGFDMSTLKPDEAAMVIGDRAFRLEKLFDYHYDLAAEWIQFTGLPFVFAVWIAVKPLPPGFVHNFIQALRFGTEHITDAVDWFTSLQIDREDAIDYLENNINFTLDEAKMKGMKLFLELCKQGIRQ
ncbi:MAG: menaquinone biosynthesis protein [Bacteroidia bacterium]|nr:menaquinone biosynthesis protein [Bacteroidia bacterium]